MCTEWVERKEKKKSYVFPSRLQQHQQQPASIWTARKKNWWLLFCLHIFLSLPHFLPLHLLCYLSNLIRNECWYVLYVLFRKGMLAFFLLVLLLLLAARLEYVSFFMYMYVLSTSHINFYLCLVSFCIRLFRATNVKK